MLGQAKQEVLLTGKGGHYFEGCCLSDQIYVCRSKSYGSFGISYLIPLSSDAAASIVSDYFEWQTQLRGANFIPSTDDDVDLRTYLFYLHTNGADRVTLDEQTSALKQFYRWAQTQRVITDNPFDEYDFAQPSLASAKITRGSGPYLTT